MLYAALKVDGTGSADMTTPDGDPSVDYQYIVPAGKIAHIERVLIVVQDTGMLPALFGGTTALSTGLVITALEDNDTVLLDFTADVTIKDNTDWGGLAGPDAVVRDTNQVQQDELLVRWTLGRSGAALLLTAGQKFNVTVADDVTGLTKFNMFVQGRIFTA
jgi:hypothetical protein